VGIRIAIHVHLQDADTAAAAVWFDWPSC
jgi:hypothetical protein